MKNIYGMEWNQRIESLQKQTLSSFFYSVEVVNDDELMTNYNRHDSSSVTHMLRCINHINVQLPKCLPSSERWRDMDYRRTLWCCHFLSISVPIVSFFFFQCHDFCRLDLPLFSSKGTIRVNKSWMLEQQLLTTKAIMDSMK